MGLFDSISQLFGGGKNPANAAMPYYNQIQGQTQQYNQPFFNAGKAALDPLQEQYKSLLGDPGGMVNKFGESFHQSPGFKFALENALSGAGHAAAAGGMAGTPQHQFQAMDVATGLANQDYNNYLQNAMGLYGQGLQGEQGLAGMGQQSGNNIANMIAQTLAQQGNLEYGGQAQKNANVGSMFGNIAQGVGSLAAFNPWHIFGNI